MAPRPTTGPPPPKKRKSSNKKTRKETLYSQTISSNPSCTKKPHNPIPSPPKKPPKSTPISLPNPKPSEPISSIFHLGKRNPQPRYKQPCFPRVGLLEWYIYIYIYIYILYTPSLGFKIAVPGRERAQGRFRGSTEGARGSNEGAMREQ